MDREPSPEERLLRLIKHKPKTQGPRPDGAEDKKGPPPKTEKQNEEIYIRRAGALSHFKNVDFINRMLFLAFILLAIYFLIDYFFIAPISVEKFAGREAGAPEAAAGEPVRQPYSYYQEEIRGKDLFAPLYKEEQDISGGAAEAAFEDVSSGLSLLGVVSGASPQAIIQDNKSNKTYFLSKGDSLGEIKLKDILEAEGKVILLYKGKEFSLGL